MSLATTTNTGIVRKRLGCRQRDEADLVEAKDVVVDDDDDHENEQEEEHDDDDDCHDEEEEEEEEVVSSEDDLVNAVGARAQEEDFTPGKRIHFTSPRLFFDDEDLFPTQQCVSYKKSEERWERIGTQAACHRQDGAVLTIRSDLSPMVLRIGLTQEARRRVRHVFLSLGQDSVVPAWLDTLEEFPNLTHLNFIDDDEDDEAFEGQNETAASARMRRLYVLYRLPHLVSIDDVCVTDQERRMARPDDDTCVDQVVDDDENCDDGLPPEISTSFSSRSGKPANELEVEINTDLAARVKDLNNDKISSVSTDTEDQLDMADMELASVASTDIEWSAACGVLTFRSDRACAPRLRLPFSSGRKKKVLAVESAKLNLRKKLREQDRNSFSTEPITTPQAGCCTMMRKGKQVPASKSLSSPFPMQFRERHKPATSNMDMSPTTSISTLETKASPKTQIVKAAPSTRRGLPPPCPSSGTRKVVSVRQRKSSKRQLRQMQARSTSVLDDLDSDEEMEDSYDEESHVPS